MTYIDTLDAELSNAGIPAARRRRILDEFADHLHEDPGAELGAPRALAGQFADELGTRLARTTAFRAFAALALVGTALVAMLLAVGRMRGLTLGNNQTATPDWAAPILMFSVLGGQLALAAGGAALLRAWRLREQAVINRREATVLARRAAVGVVAGAVALLALPALAVAFHRQAGTLWDTSAWIVFGLGLLTLAAALHSLRLGIRLRPELDGQAGDLISDLGQWAPQRLTPTRAAWLLATAIVVALGLLGLVTDDPFDGLARGLADALACLAGFAVLGRYLGLQTTAR